MANQSTAFPNVQSTSLLYSPTGDFNYLSYCLEPYLITSAPSILLSIVTITLNIFIINYYRKSELSLVPLLYTMIASADILTAVGVIHQSVAFPLFINRVIGVNSIEIHAVVFYTVIQISYRSSVFYNLVLAVSRTIMILRPFVQIKIGAVKVACILYIVPWLILAAFDINQFYLVENQFVSTIYFNSILSMGTSISDYFDIVQVEALFYILFIYLPQLIAFIIPVLIIFITCVVQLVSLHRSSRFPASNNQRHVTITVVLISTLFVVCNSAFHGLLLYLYCTTDYTLYIVTRAAVLGTVLPILNAALNPIIIITRSNGLRVKFEETMRQIKSLW